MFIIELILLIASYLIIRYLYVLFIYQYNMKSGDFTMLVIVNLILDIVILFIFNFIAGFVMFNFLINQTLIMPEKIIALLGLMIIFLILCALRFSIINSMIIYFAPLVETNKQNMKNIKVKGSKNIVI